MSLIYRLIRPALFVTILNSLWLSGFAQSISIVGPNCVAASAVYLYNIVGQWQPGSTVRVCVTGGTLVDSGGTCAGGGGIISFVRVTWDSGGQSSCSVNVTSSLGDTTLTISVSTAMSGGQIDSAVANQSLDTTTTPATLTLSAPSGGGCQFSYSFQWQLSLDNVIWQNITDATSAQLSFSGPLSQTTYYRRITTNLVSNAFDYSNVATLSLPIQTPQ